MALFQRQDLSGHWRWDPARCLYYAYDARHHRFIFYDHSSQQYLCEDGQQISRSATPGQAASLQGSTTTVSPTSSHVYSSSRASSWETFAQIRPDTTLSVDSRPRDTTPSTSRRPDSSGNNGSVWTDLVVDSSTMSVASPLTPATGPRLDSVGSYTRLESRKSQDEAEAAAFRLRSPEFFRVGRVFQVLWAEPSAETKTDITGSEVSDAMKSGILAGRHGELVHCRVRRLIVIREGKGYCNALAIVTYGHQGVAKAGVAKSEHAIIYTGRQPPHPDPNEMPKRGEQPMRPSAIRIVPNNPTDKLDPMARINFGKVYTLEHNVKAKALGLVHPASMQALRVQFTNVWLSAGSATASNDAGAPDPQSHLGNRGGMRVSMSGVSTSTSRSCPDSTRSSSESIDSLETRNTARRISTLKTENDTEAKFGE